MLDIEKTIKAHEEQLYEGRPYYADPNDADPIIEIDHTVSPMRGLSDFTDSTWTAEVKCNKCGDPGQLDVRRWKDGNITVRLSHATNHGEWVKVEF